MTARREHLELLKNAVRQSVATLTVVEVDTVARAHGLVDLLKFELDKRPGALLSLTAVPGAATRLLDAFCKITETWHPGTGVLFLIDDGQKKDEGGPRFWADMNAQRESRDALNCHIIFFLLPSNYRLLLQAAEHLADWMPLKLHITDPADVFRYEDKDRASYQNAILGFSILTPKIARQQLAILEQQLAVALHEGIPRQTLARRYYLPMFEAAMSLSDLNRAQSLRQKVLEKDLQAGDIIKWWEMNFWLDYLLHRLDRAESWADKLSKWTDKTGDKSLKAESLHNLGMIAEERREFEEAEDWYKKSLKIKEQLGNEHGAAITYWQLGYLGLLEGRVEDSGRWSVKSIAAFSMAHDPDRANQAINNFLIAWQKASQSEQRKLKQLWDNAGLGPLPDAVVRG
ncbi:MAG: hypothetical protein DRH21_02075 [Deltaproteobacteria bacterium]|nr:MAG: hypothetical protein DRH21_02075 [Deltaproteobacteria bacterium]